MATESGDLRPVPALFDGVWRVFSDLRVTLALLMLGAILMVTPVLFPGITAAGVAPITRMALALLAFSLALRLARHVERALRLRARRYLPPDAGLPVVTVPLEGTPEQSRKRAEAVLGAICDRVIAEDADPTRLWGVRRPTGVIGPILAAAGALVLLLGLLINATWGQVTRDLRLVEGAPFVVTDDGARLGLMTGALAVERSGGAAAYFAAEPLRPALSGLHWIFPRAAGATLQVAATDAAGQAAPLLALEPDATTGAGLNLPFRANQTEQTFTAPDQGLVFRAVSYPALPERGVAGPVFLVEAYRQGASEPVLNELVQEAADLKIDGATVALRRGRYVTADVAYAPGWPLLALGGLISLIGLLIVFFLSAQEAWIDLPHGVRRVLAVVRTSGGLTPGHVAAALIAALQGESSTGL